MNDEYYSHADGVRGSSAGTDRVPMDLLLLRFVRWRLDRCYNYSSVTKRRR